MKILTSIAIGLLTLTSCRTIPTRWEKTNYTIKDSTIVNISYKDTLILLPKTEAVIDGLNVKVDSLGKAQLDPVEVKYNKAKVKVAIKDGKLSAVGGCAEDSLKLLLQQKETRIYNLEKESKEKVESKVKQVKHIPEWIAILAVIGAIAISLVLYKVIKKISP